MPLHYYSSCSAKDKDCNLLKPSRLHRAIGRGTDPAGRFPEHPVPRDRASGKFTEGLSPGTDPSVKLPVGYVPRDKVVGKFTEAMSRGTYPLGKVPERHVPGDTRHSKTSGSVCPALRIARKSSRCNGNFPQVSVFLEKK